MLFFPSIIERSVLMALVFYYEDIVGKGNDALLLNACAVARKIETDCFGTNLPISYDPVVRISRNLAK